MGTTIPEIVHRVPHGDRPVGSSARVGALAGVRPLDRSEPAGAEAPPRAPDPLTRRLDDALSGADLPLPGSWTAREVTRSLRSLGDRYGLSAPDLLPGDLSDGARRVEVGRFLQAVETQALANELLAARLTQEVLGVRVDDLPTRVLARALGLASIDPRSMRALSAVARGDVAEKALAEAPLFNALDRVLLERTSLSSDDLTTLLTVEGSLDEARLLALSRRTSTAPALREAARKVSTSPELKQAIFRGADPRAQLVMLRRRVERLESSGHEGRVRLDAFYAGAEEDAEALRGHLEAGAVGEALAMLAGRDRGQRAWLVNEYDARFGDGALGEDLREVEGGRWVAAALVRDEGSRAALIAGLAESALRARVLDGRLRAVKEELCRFETGYAGLLERIAGVTPRRERLAELGSAIGEVEAKRKAQAPLAEVAGAIARAELVAEAIRQELVGNADRGIAFATLSSETAKALLITAGAAAVTTATLGAAAPASAGLAAVSWAEVAGALAAGTGAGLTAGTIAAVGEEAFASTVYGRRWSWSRVGDESRRALAQAATGALMAGLTGATARNLAQTPAGRAVLARYVPRSVVLGAAQGVAAGAGEATSAVLEHPTFDGATMRRLEQVGPNALRAGLSGALLGPVAGAVKGTRGVALDATLGAGEQVAANAVTGRPLDEGVVEAGVSAAVLGATNRALEADPRIRKVREVEAAQRRRFVVREGRAEGATLGPNVYRLDNVRTTTNGAVVGALNVKRLERRVPKAPRAHGATLHRNAERAYTLAVPTHAGGRADVEVTLHLDGDPKARAHGDVSGPAKLHLSRENGRWRADVVVNSRLADHDLELVLGHEIDEVADIVHHHHHDPDADISKETRAGVFRPDAQPNAKATAHDRAAARELYSLYQRLAQAEAQVERGNSESAANVKAWKRSIVELECYMGVDDPVLVDQKMKLLATASEDLHLVHAPYAGKQPAGDVLKRIKAAWADRVEALGRQKYEAILQAHSDRIGRPSRLDTALVAHLQDPRANQPAHVPIVGADHPAAHATSEADLAALPPAEAAELAPRVATLQLQRMAGRFKRDGIHGGHMDAELRRFVEDHPDLGYVLVAEREAIVDGVTYREYAQYMWAGAGPIPPSTSAGYPRAGFGAGPGWVKADVPKTTVDRIDPLLGVAESASVQVENTAQNDLRIRVGRLHIVAHLNDGRVVSVYPEF